MRKSSGGEMRSSIRFVHLYVIGKVFLESNRQIDSRVREIAVREIDQEVFNLLRFRIKDHLEYTIYENYQK